MARLQNIYDVPDSYGKHLRDRKIGHNTYCYREGRGFCLRYHSTDVVNYREFAEIGARRVTINTGGWFSVTTAQRIRHALQEVGLQLSTNDLPGRWRVMDRRGNAWTIRGDKLMLRHDGNEWVRISH